MGVTVQRPRRQASWGANECQRLTKVEAALAFSDHCGDEKGHQVGQGQCMHGTDVSWARDRVSLVALWVTEHRSESRGIRDLGMGQVLEGCLWPDAWGGCWGRRLEGWVVGGLARACKEAVGGGAWAVCMWEAGL